MTGPTKTMFALGLTTLVVGSMALVESQGVIGPPRRRGPSELVTCTPGPAPNGDDVVQGLLPLTFENVVLAEDGRQFSPCGGFSLPGSLMSRDVAEADLLSRAARSADARLRALAATAIGRRLDRLALASLGQLLNDREAMVRLAAADAIGVVMSPLASELSRSSALTSRVIQTARMLLSTRLPAEPNDVVAATLLETLGRLDLEDLALAEVEAVLRSHAAGKNAPLRVLGAVKGLEALIRRHPSRALDPETRSILREVSTVGRMGTSRQFFVDRTPPPEEIEILARSRRLAMLALQSSHDDDVDTILRAAADPDWQVRRIAVQRMDPAVAIFAIPLEAALADAAFQVRLEAVKALSPSIARTKVCAPLVKAFSDPVPQVAMQAFDALPSECGETDDLVRELASEAQELRTFSAAWHVPARALMALARVAPDQARLLNDEAATHPAWQVRATAAAAAAAIGDERVLAALAKDTEPNVRTAAIEGMAKSKSPQLSDAAMRALESTDFQLVRTAARSLGQPADPAPATSALLAALRRLTDLGSDTSRDARLALIERIQSLDPDYQRGELRSYADDVDPRIATRVRFGTIGGDQMAPNIRWRRYPAQPTLDQLRGLPRAATIHMRGGLGTFDLELLVEAAPVTVARFAALVNARYYDGLTFHRVVPNFVIQGGSPGANEYAGDRYYWRDELGVTPHLRGSVGLSTRGYDTGDGQFFIDLGDLPRLDHQYTVFARVSSGLDVVDRILEGAVIDAITLRKQ